MRDAMPCCARASRRSESAAFAAASSASSRKRPSQDELARGPSGERLGDREKVVEPLRVGRDDHDCPLSRRRGRLLRRQGRVMAKDRLLELLQGRARLDAELVDEQPPRLAIDLERLGLATRAVERLHEHGPQPLAEWVLADEHLDLADELGVAAEREVGLEPPLERLQAELFEARNLGLRERLVGEVGKRRPAPEVESFAQSLRRKLGRRPLAPPRPASRSEAGRARPGRRGSRNPAPA